MMRSAASAERTTLDRGREAVAIQASSPAPLATNRSTSARAATTVGVGRQSRRRLPPAPGSHGPGAGRGRDTRPASRRGGLRSGPAEDRWAPRSEGPAAAQQQRDAEASRTRRRVGRSGSDMTALMPEPADPRAPCLAPSPTPSGVYPRSRRSTAAMSSYPRDMRGYGPAAPPSLARRRPHCRTVRGELRGKARTHPP